MESAFHRRLAAGGTLARVDLRAHFEPRSIALIGASADPLSISARPLRMLLQHGFTGSLYPVNPNYAELYGMPVYPSIAAVPEQVDLALVAVPAPAVLPVLEECAQAGVRFAVVLSSGFAEAGADGQRLQRAIAELVASSGLRVNGPNAEGFYYPAGRLCATFSPALDPEHGFLIPPPTPTLTPTPTPAPTGRGSIAVISQSGGLGFAILNHGRELGLDFGAVVSTGNEVDLGWLDYASHLLDQPQIRLILGFVEGFRRTDRLEEVATRAARLKKPLIIAKIGRSQAAASAAASHTGSDVGNDEQYEAAFRALGILRVEDIDEMLDLAAYFSIGRLPAGRRLGVLTTSGGAGAWLVDACATRGFEVPPLDARAQDEIKSFIPSYGCTANPIDITAQAVFSGGFERALGILLRSPGVDVVAGVGSMVREDRFLSSLPELREAIDGVDRALCFYSYTRPSRAVTGALAELGIPCYTTPVRAARALAAAATYAEFIRSGRLVHDGAD